MKSLLLAVVLLGLVSPLLACVGPNCDLYLDRIRLPAGFQIDYFVPHVVGARSIFLSPSNILYIGTRTTGDVYAGLDLDGDNVVEQLITIISGLNQPNGIAFRDGNLWVVEVQRILRFDNIDELLITTGRPPTPVVVRSDLPQQSNHAWRYAAFNPNPADPYLYVAVGADCNICEVNGLFGTISRFDSRNPTAPWEIVARGVRNSVGFGWHPVTGEFWFTENGRDNWGNDIPGDELNRIANNVQGLHYGFPYCYEKDLVDTEFNTIGNCNPYVPAAQVLGPHVAALGNVFYTGTNFPRNDYYLNLFIAEHGSWNRQIPIGYRITLVRMNAQGTAPIEGTGAYTVFADGWLPDGAAVGSQAWGRPVDIKMLKDGSLVLSDDKNNCVYRIYYTGTDRESGKNGENQEGISLVGPVVQNPQIRLYLIIGGSILIVLGVLLLVIGGLVLRKYRRCAHCQNKACQKSSKLDQGEELKAMLNEVI